MAEKSKIPWTDCTLDLVGGCTKASAGCRECYAERLVGNRLAHNPVCKGRYEGLVGKDGHWTGKIKLFEDRLGKPLHWRDPRRIFVCPYSDLFHKGVPFEFVDRVMAMVALCPRHTFQVLTKRPERMAEYFKSQPYRDYADSHKLYGSDGGRIGGWFLVQRPSIKNYPVWGDVKWPLPNLWLGTSVEDQDNEPRIKHLLDTPAAVHFLSVEPMLGPLDIFKGRQAECGYYSEDRRENGCEFSTERCDNCRDFPRYMDTGIDWVIIGAESGPGRRPCKVEWVRDLVGQCDAAGVPVFVKPSRHFEWPKDLKDRQAYPAPKGPAPAQRRKENNQ